MAHWPTIAASTALAAFVVAGALIHVGDAPGASGMTVAAIDAAATPAAGGMGSQHQHQTPQTRPGWMQASGEALEHRGDDVARRLVGRGRAAGHSLVR